MKKGPTRLKKFLTHCKFGNGYKRTTVAAQCQSLATSLPAIAGLAATLSPSFGGGYLAGHWRKYLKESLLWRPLGEFGHSVTSYRAPSSSWASLDGRITNLYTTDLSTCEILDCRTTPKDSQLPFGEVVAGFVKIRSAFQRGRLLPSSDKSGRILELKRNRLLWGNISNQEAEIEPTYTQANNLMIHGSWGLCDIEEDIFERLVDCIVLGARVSSDATILTISTIRTILSLMLIETDDSCY